MSGTTQDLAPAGHDDHLYDPNRHDNQIVAVYETMDDAKAAKSALLGAGIDDGAVQIMDRSATGVTTAPADEGLWASIKSLFAPDEEAHAYGHALERGHAMLVVTPAATANRTHIIEVLEGTNPIDFDSKLEEWRQAGYGYSDSAGTAPAATGVAAATFAAPNTHPTTVDPTTVDTDRSMATARPAMTPVAGGEDTIKVVQERLRVGKREVAGGAVRVRSYVVERPVEEQVRLHEERINIERRPVDRPASEADAAAFQDRTIEARATSEEAIISKEARVVEEIGIRKDVSDRVETVRDTVRETKVEVEDTTTGRTTPTGTETSTATPGATSSGMNAPRK